MAGTSEQRGGGSGLRWAIALPASLAIHAILGFALIQSGVDPARMAAAAENTSQLEIPIKLGIERSDAVTTNWLGFEEPEPQVAAPSRVEQSQLTRAEGDQADNLSRAVAASVQAATSEAVSETRAVLDALRAEFVRAMEQAAQSQPQPQPEPAREAPQQREPRPQPPAESTTAEDSEQDGSPGQQDTRASPASSLPVEMRRTQMGRVVAAEGLKINTTRMRLTDLQRVRGRPPSPLVEIFFDHEGNVSRARIPRGRGSGRSDIDNALINAIYEWTATGERIDALEEGDRPLLIRMRILL